MHSTLQMFTGIYSGTHLQGLCGEIGVQGFQNCRVFSLFLSQLKIYHVIQQLTATGHVDYQHWVSI